MTYTVGPLKQPAAPPGQSPRDVLCEACGQSLGVVNSPAGPETHKNLASAQVESLWPETKDALASHETDCPSLTS